MPASLLPETAQPAPAAGAHCLWITTSESLPFCPKQDESSVQQLIEACITDEDKLYLCVSSPTIKDKPVQIRPWRLSDADYVLDASMPLDPRKTVFVGGVPRPLKARECCVHLVSACYWYDVENIFFFLYYLNVYINRLHLQVLSCLIGEFVYVFDCLMMK